MTFCMGVYSGENKNGLFGRGAWLGLAGWLAGGHIIIIIINIITIAA